MNSEDRKRYLEDNCYPQFQKHNWDKLKAKPCRICGFDYARNDTCLWCGATGYQRKSVTVPDDRDQT